MATTRRVAVLCDIHGNLPALEAVLEDVRKASVDLILIGGDVLPGPMPAESLELLAGLDTPVQHVHGNGDLAVLAQVDAGSTGAVTYWGTTSGAPLPGPLQEAMHWTAEQIPRAYAEQLRTWPRTLRADIAGLSEVLLFHGTPRSETECFTRLTPEERLLEVFCEVDAPLGICGHTHMQFDRMIGGTRVVNAGSVGMPFGQAGAEWLLLEPGIQLKRTDYDLRRAASRIEATGYPQRREFAAHVRQPPSEESMLRVLTDASLG